MKKIDELLTFYSQVLDAVDLKVDDAGAITFEPPGAVGKDGKPMVMEAIVEGKRWVLPTKEILDESPWDNMIAFHPLSENVLNGESAVIGKLKGAINLKLNRVVGELMGQLTRFAADPSSQGNVSARAGKFLKLVPNLKEISAKRMVEIVERSGQSPDRRFVNLYLKKGGKVGDLRYQCAAILRFPFREELEGEVPRAFGVDLSKKDQASFKALFDYILPDSDDLATYSVGSSVNTASKFDALLKAFAAIAKQLNSIIDLHKKILPSYKDLSINLDWLETLGTIDKLADVIPPLPGNIGETARDARTEGAASQAAPATTRRLFETKLPVKNREEAAVPTAQSHPAAARVTETGPTHAPAKNPADLTFSERLKLQQEQESLERKKALGYGRSTSATPAYGARQYQSATSGVPVWYDGTATTRVVAGHDPRLEREERELAWRNRDSANVGGVRSLSDRLRQASTNGNYRSGRGGGSFQV